MRRRSVRNDSGALRERLAQESARLMIEHGIVDFGLAKRKAAERLAVRALGALPSNAQIEQCLAERQRIFEPHAHGERVNDLRRIAARMMELLAHFEPRLVGAVLAGTATINAAIELHVFSDTPEPVAGVLDEYAIAYGAYERRYRYNGHRSGMIPGFSFVHDAQRVVVLVFPENGLREAPLSPVDGRPMQRASRAKVAELLRA